MYALRERRVHVTQEDFEMAVAKVQTKLISNIFAQGCTDRKSLFYFRLCKKSQKRICQQNKCLDSDSVFLPKILIAHIVSFLCSFIRTLKRPSSGGFSWVMPVHLSGSVLAI